MITYTSDIGPFRTKGTVSSHSSAMLTISCVITVLGMCSLAAGLFWASKSLRLDQNGIRTSAIVTDVAEKRKRENDGKYKITYTSSFQFAADDGKSYNFKQDGYQRVGERVEIIYNPLNPSEASTSGFGQLWVGPMIFGVLGLVFSALGSHLVLKTIRRRSEVDWLQKNGVQIVAKVIGIKEHVSKRDSNLWHGSPRQRSFCIVATWSDPETGREFRFQSEPHSRDPGDYLIGKELPIVIDPSNPDLYFFAAVC